MSSAPLVLHSETHWISPYVFSCWVALHEKKLPFETRVVALEKSEQKSAGYGQRSITARVPALDHGDFSVAESSAILEYLEDTFPAPAHARILPADARPRARARQLMSWLRSDDTLPIRDERPTTTMFYAPAKKPLGDTARRATQKLFAVGERLLTQGGTKTSLFGAWCIADVEMAFMLHRLIISGDDVPGPLRAFAEAQWARDAVQSFVKHARPATYTEY